jgi:succinate dehydrogenase / fumarate reductase iron-sulfur subunit
MSAEAATRRFRVHRYRREDGPAHVDEFDVPADEASTVLAGLRWIEVHEDRSLVIRHSCFHASCGTCGVRVNGREGLACVTPVTTDTVTVEPLANIPVLADVVVDMRPFVERFPPQHPLLRMSEARVGGEARMGVAEDPERFEDCIECGLCLSACPVAGDPRFLGPAALAAAERVLEEPRGADPTVVLGLVDDAHGAWRCHTAFECSAVCPAGVDPGGAIMRLRGRLLRDRLPRLVGKYHREVRS